MKIKKILIANRGEIAIRVMRSAKEMGIKTVAVYSEADKAAAHVLYADEAVLIGPPPSAQSYLVADKIIEACKLTGADAVHPGYGFLSENAQFAEKIAQAGIIFIGPSVEAIKVMGDKLASKQAVKSFDVPLVPGMDEPISDAGEDRRRDRLSGDDQGLCRRWRQGDADRLERRRGARGLFTLEIGSGELFW